ncbi:MAG: hypothetical protein NTX24_00880 [Candidatus Pacearchaeota archaeon]|nr:hypothetical protein [Candidatus Pacearchaeota archaeon]
MKGNLILFFILLLTATIFINGCQKDKYGFEFSSSSCNLEMGQYNRSSLGINKTDWINNNKLQITVLVERNCADVIKEGYYQINENKVSLFYDVEECSPCTTCLCVKNLTYAFSNIPRKNYTFELKEV